VTRRSTPPLARSVRASGDRWLFGYADIVTLLFACFASLYAATVAPAAKSLPRDIQLRLDPKPDDDPMAALGEDLRAIAEDNTGGTSVDLDRTSRGLVLSLAETGSFPTGSAEMTTAARRIMLIIADALEKVPNLIRVEGHTDDAPIRTPLFESNWELSTARASRVVRLLAEEGGLDPERLSAAGYAEYRPRLPNTSVVARARNRRVDIVVLDLAAATAEAPEMAQR
jgi:chemotaxis protein MotB